MIAGTAFGVEHRVLCSMTAQEEDMELSSVNGPQVVPGGCPLRILLGPLGGLQPLARL